MSEAPPQESIHGPQPGSRLRLTPTRPSSSRMFASSLTDIEQLLDHRRWDTALREACDLPRLAVALADPNLRCAPEQVATWCQEWIRPADAERDAQGLDSERLVRRALERITQLTGGEAVPLHALRRLQLRRHVRMHPRGFPAGAAGNVPPREAENAELCAALLEAARRWYARSACHDPIVQGNLARLAVLR